MKIKHYFTEDDLRLWPHKDAYLLEILNDEYHLDVAREDLLSLVNREHYDGQPSDV